MVIVEATKHQSSCERQRWLFSSLFLLRRYVLIAALLLFALIPRQVLAEEVIDVTIQGIEGRLYDNVEASLKIYKKRKQEDLSDKAIKRLHNGAEEEIKTALQPFGYYSPVIVSKLDRSEGNWQANYMIDAGEPVRITSIDITIKTKEIPSHVLSAILSSYPLKEGHILDHPLYDKGKKLLLQKLFSLGFLKAEYSQNEIRVNRTTRSGEIILILESGPRFLFGKTYFDQELLDEELLQRFVHYREGEPYSQKKLNTLQRELYKTNYFGQVVIKGDIEKAENLHVPITVSLSKPSFFNRYNLGVGYASDDGIRGRIGWKNRLFNSGGHTISSELKLSERENNLGFVYGVPVLDPRFDKIHYGVTYEDEVWDDTDTKLFKGGINYLHTGKKYKYTAGFEVRDEQYQVGATTGESFLPVPKLSLTAIFADDPVKTSNGLIISSSIIGASEDLLGDATFLQGQLSGKIIVTPLRNFRIIGRITLGGTYVDSIDDLPPSLRFYAGGDQSVRGYSYKELGPEDSSGTVIGGKYLIFSSIEAEQVVSGNWSLAAFLDSGNAMNDISDDLEQGAGIGVRYRLPFGQLKIDVASAISEEDNPLRLHFTVGGDL